MAFSVELMVSIPATEETCPICPFHHLLSTRSSGFVERSFDPWTAGKA